MIRVSACLALGFRIRRLAPTCYVVEQHGAYLAVATSLAASLRQLAGLAGTVHP